MSGVTTICFAASYTVALLLELSRLVFRSGMRRVVMIGFATAGLVAHSAFLYYQVVGKPGSLLSSQHDWYLLAAWALVIVYLYLAICRPRQAFGVFLLPLVLALIGVATFVASPEPYTRVPASQIWGIVHGTSILLTTVVVLFGFVTGVMYFEQSRRLKKKRLPVRGLQLPSLEWLCRANGRAIVVSVALLAVGVLSGLVLSRLSHDGHLHWNDPVVLVTLGMFFWLLAAAMVYVLPKPVQAGRKVAYLTLVSFVFLVVMLSTVLWLDTTHGGQNIHIENSDYSNCNQGFRVPLLASEKHAPEHRRHCLQFSVTKHVSGKQCCHAIPTIVGSSASSGTRDLDPPFAL